MELNEEEEKGHPSGKALLANECPLTEGMSITEQLWPFVVKPGIPRQRKTWVLLEELSPSALQNVPFAGGPPSRGSGRDTLKALQYLEVPL